MPKINQGYILLALTERNMLSDKNFKLLLIIIAMCAQDIRLQQYVFLIQGEPRGTEQKLGSWPGRKVVMATDHENLGVEQ